MIDEEISQASDTKSKYEQWKASIPGADSKSYHLSLGHSVKLMAQLEGDFSKLSFKTYLKFAEINDDDSGASQSSFHNQKFFIDDETTGFQNKQNYEAQFSEVISAELFTLLDIKEGQEVNVLIKFKPDGPILNLFDGRPKDRILPPLFSGQEKFKEDYPILVRYLLKKVDGHRGQSFAEHVSRFSSADFRRAIAHGVQIYYETTSQETSP